MAVRIKSSVAVILTVIPSMILMSCNGECINQPDPNPYPNREAASTESGQFEGFQYQEVYARVVEKAENGDRESILKLSQYYANFPYTDLRNLEYWSEKAARYEGKLAYWNLILSLALHGRCERAWEILDRNYPNRSDFDFYKSNERTETIDEICPRRRT